MDWYGLLILLFIILMGYFIGSIPFGLIITKIFINKDIREIGSGNIGATNVLRTGNKKLAIATLLLDVSKGAVLIIITVGGIPALKHGGMFFSTELYILYALVIGIGAILGHCFPVWLKFKGGKGVATALGVLLAAVPYAGLVAVLAWISSAFAFRISSLAALIAAAIAPIATFFIYGQSPAIITALITALIFIRHKDNIKRLIAGTEPKIGGKKKDAV